MSERCFYCGEELPEGASFCPSCHKDQTTYKRLIYESDMYYNSGLEKARVRDLTGAIQSLRESLRINKYNTDARNLLGLIFYARGNDVEAICEWVISKNLQPDDNRADYYLKDAQKPGAVEKANQTAEKYNRALEQCRAGNTDLAKLQLKRLAGSGSRDMDAHQLLALIYLKEKNYNEAKKVVKAAQEIDINDTVILKYKKEIRLAEKDKKKQKNKQPGIVNFNDGNDNVIMTKGAFRDFTDGSRTAVINIIVGIVIGVLACYFLIIPGIRQDANSDATNSIVNANETATSSQNSVVELNRRVEELQTELEKYSTKSDTVTSYEEVLQANEAVAAQNMSEAKSHLEKVNVELLSDKAKSLYDNLNSTVNEETTRTSYEAAVKAYNSGDYVTAADNFQTVVALQEGYLDGEALFRLGETYFRLEQYENALANYNRAQEIKPDSQIARRAARSAKSTQKKIDEAAAASNEAGQE